MSDSEPPAVQTKSRKKLFAFLFLIDFLILAGVIWWFFIRDDSPPGPPPKEADVSGVDEGELEESDYEAAVKRLRAARDAVEEVDSYTATFLKQERDEDGELGEFRTVKLKLKHEPLSIYFRSVEPDGSTSAQVIYVEGKNDGKMLALKSGISLFGWRPLALDGFIAKQFSKNPITYIGLLYLTNGILEDHEPFLKDGVDPKTRPEAVTTPDVEVNGQPCEMIEFRYQKPIGERNTIMQRVYFPQDAQRLIRYERHVRVDGQSDPVLDAVYIYADFEEQDLPSDAFSKDNPEYKP